MARMVVTGLGLAASEFQVARWTLAGAMQGLEDVLATARTGSSCCSALSDAYGGAGIPQWRGERVAQCSSPASNISMRKMRCSMN